MFCGNCGAEVNGKYCPNCGTENKYYVEDTKEQEKNKNENLEDQYIEADNKVDPASIPVSADNVSGFDKFLFKANFIVNFAMAAVAGIACIKLFQEGGFWGIVLGIAAAIGAVGGVIAGIYRLVTKNKKVHRTQEEIRNDRKLFFIGLPVIVVVIFVIMLIGRVNILETVKTIEPVKGVTFEEIVDEVIEKANWSIEPDGKDHYMVYARGMSEEVGSEVEFCFDVSVEGDYVSARITGITSNGINIMDLFSYLLSYEDEDEYDYISQGKSEGQLLLDEISKGSFGFFSGVGAWESDMRIYSDGSFEGSYHDSSMDGDSFSDFFGRFSIPQRINDYTFSMNLVSLETEYPEGYYYYEDDHMYTAVAPYGIDGAGEVLVFLPESKVSKLPEGFVSWMERESVGYGEFLGTYGLYNVNEELGWAWVEA